MKLSKKNFLLKTAAVVACFGIICLSFPGVVQAAERKVHKPDFRTFQRTHMPFLYNLLPIFSRIYIPVEKLDRISDDTSDSSGKIKLLGTVSGTRGPKDKD